MAKIRANFGIETFEFFEFILSLLSGTIPSPALFGWLFDVACLKWGTDVCSGEKGNCYIYDNKMLSNLFLVLGLICQSVTLLFLVLALVTYRGTTNDDKEEPVTM